MPVEFSPAIQELLKQPVYAFLVTPLSDGGMAKHVAAFCLTDDGR